MDKGIIVNIRVENLYPHPENPRKDIGDISELAESIKKSGIMQNLTVIPLDALDEEPDKQTDADKISPLSDFIVLIGHRRLAAAKQAGLKEVPCKIISHISKKEQVGIMLEENMQRSDLTIYEQAQGFQMMLDLGETEQTIAEKTGFSKTTIRRRLNIAKLDQKVLKDKQDDEAFQLSLTDLYELDKVEDVKLRNKILKEARSSNELAGKVKSCVEELKREANVKKFKALFKKMGIKAAPKGAENEMYSNKWDTVKSFKLSEDVPETIKIDKDADKCFYLVYWREMRIITKKVKEKRELTEAELKEKELKKNERQLKAMLKEISAERKDFIKLAIEKKFKPEKVKIDDLQAQIFRLMISFGCWMSESTMTTFLLNKSSWELTNEEKAEFEKTLKNLPLVYQMLVYVENMLADKSVVDWNGAYRMENGEAHKILDTILELFGFTYSKPEYEQVIDGTHELYNK